MSVKKVVTVCASLLVAGVGAYALFNGKGPKKYGDKWFRTVSDEVLNAEREIVRKEFCSAGDDFSRAVNLQNLLRRFDAVISKRAWGDEIPHGPSYHREHGFNLYKPD